MISVTALSAYLYCSRKLYLERVLGFYEPPKEVLVKGTIRHKIHENVNLVDEELVKSIEKGISLDDLKGKYHQKYREIATEAIKQNRARLDQFNILPQDLFKQIWPLILSEAETRADSVYNFIVKNNVFGQELWEKLVPKIKSEVKIRSESLMLSGVIDQIEVYPSGLVPLELKTGKMPKEGVWPGHRIQIGAYALLLEEAYHHPIKEGFVVYLDSKERRHIAINEFIKLEVRELIQKVDSLLKSKEIPDFCGNENKCLACGLKEDCYDTHKLQKLLKNK